MKSKYNIAGSFKAYKEQLHESFFKPQDEEAEEIADDLADAVEAGVDAADEIELEDDAAPAPGDGEECEDSEESCLPGVGTKNGKPIPAIDPPAGMFGGGAMPTSHSISVEFSLGGDTSATDALTSQPSFERPEWVVTRVMTDRGERIAMEKQSETDCEILASNLSYEAAEQLSTELSRKLDIPEFDNTTDKYIGKISPKVVRKDKPTGGSYKY